MLPTAQPSPWVLHSLLPIQQALAEDRSIVCQAWCWVLGFQNEQNTASSSQTDGEKTHHQLFLKQCDVQRDGE